MSDLFSPSQLLDAYHRREIPMSQAMALLKIDLVSDFMRALFGSVWMRPGPRDEKTLQEAAELAEFLREKGIYS